MLQSALDQNTEQRKITASAVLAAKRRKRQGAAAIAAIISAHQLESAALTFGSTAEQLAEQDIEAPPAGTASLSSLASGAGAVALIEKTETEPQLVRLVSSLVVQASLTASVVDMLRRPAITTYVRVLVPPSCPRCAVLAGKKFTWKAEFNRHPQCDCTALLTNDRNAEALVTDPMVAFRAGGIKGMSKADAEAVRLGADLGRVVNVRKREAGLRAQSSVLPQFKPVLTRVESLGRLRGGGRLVVDQMTPEQIRRVASTREEAIQLLGHHGYIRGVNAGKRGARIVDR